MSWMDRWLSIVYDSEVRVLGKEKERKERGRAERDKGRRLELGKVRFVFRYISVQWMGGRERAAAIYKVPRTCLGTWYLLG